MKGIPNYVGPMAMGLKMGVITPGMDIVNEVFEIIKSVHRDGLLNDGDIICITESVVARAQDNYIEVNEGFRYNKRSFRPSKKWNGWRRFSHH